MQGILVGKKMKKGTHYRFAKAIQWGYLIYCVKDAVEAQAIKTTVLQIPLDEEDLKKHGQFSAKMLQISGSAIMDDQFETVQSANHKLMVESNIIYNIMKQFMKCDQVVEKASLSITL